MEANDKRQNFQALAVKRLPLGERYPGQCLNLASNRAGFLMDHREAEAGKIVSRSLSPEFRLSWKLKHDFAGDPHIYSGRPSVIRGQSINPSPENLPSMESTRTPGMEFSRLLRSWSGEAPDFETSLSEDAVAIGFNSEGRFVFVNERFCSLSQYSREELMGRSHAVTTPRPHSGQFFRHLHQTVNGGGIWHGEIRHRARDGSFFWIVTTVIPLGEDGERPSKFLAIGTEIAEPGNAEGKPSAKSPLQQLLTMLSARFALIEPAEVSEVIQETLQIIAEALPVDCSVIWQVMENEPGMIATHGWRSSGSSIFPSAPAAGRDQLPWSYDKVMRGEIFSFSSLDELPGEAARDVETFRAHGVKSSLTIPLTAGRCSFGALSFITLRRERKWREDEISELRMLARVIGNLIGYQRAENREEQLCRELTHAMRLATLGELAGAIAHELTQPLAAILSNAQAAHRFLAAGEIEPSELEAILNDVVRDDKRAGQVLHNLRAMVSNRPAARSACCLNELALEVADLLHNELIKAGVELRLQTAPGLPPVQAVRVELQQVLVNLLTNAAHAMEFTPPESRILEVSIRLLENAIAVAVRDHGPGIPPDRLPTIFTPFLSTKATGLGLGLSICHRILKNHGGSLRAENHPDKGAVFTFTLPIEPQVSK